MNRPILYTISIFALILTGCTVGPNYKRPAVSVPDAYRTAPTLTSPSTQDFAEMKWWAVFQDTVLQDLIKEALTNNYDLRIAANRIIQAQEQLGIVRADQRPSLGGFAAIDYQRTPPQRGDHTIDSAGLQLSWILDFWGQYRRSTESARATLLSTEFAQKTVRVSLVSNVATAYFRLRSLDQQMASSKSILESNQETLRIATRLVNGGASPITDQLQAKLLVEQAQAQITQLEESISQQENEICILLGRNPGDVPRGLDLSAQPHLPEVPVGLPSALLERRPDVRESEAKLTAANANVGVAKAAFFPQIPLTASFGASSTSLLSFLSGPAAAWSIGGQAAQPLYAGGKITANYRLSWAQRDAAELTYKQTVQQALGDVSNSLVGYTKSRAFRSKLEEQTATYAETARLANDRYRGGATSFLEVLTTQQQYLNSDLQTSQARLAELQNYAQLYQALGGGWQE
jgi:multidrug efflux system outer membrane protein